MLPRIHGVLPQLYMTSVSGDQRPARERAKRHGTAQYHLAGWLVGSEE